MQSASTSLPPQQNDEHLSPMAAKMFLAALPERIQRALLAHSRETQYPLEMVLEMGSGKLWNEQAIRHSSRFQFTRTCFAMPVVIGWQTRAMTRD